MSVTRFKIGELPPVGEVPKTMLAQVIRQDRYGDPRSAFKVEEVPVPELQPDQVLIAVMATGINFNNVWAARGLPIDVIAIRQRKGEPWDFHVGGSDASGIVYAVGAAVDTVAVGDEVVVHHGYWDADDPWVVAGNDPMLAPSARIWGYDTNFGSFGQFTVAQAHQVMPKAPHLTWEQAGAPTLVGTTAYRMLFGWQGNTLQRNDVVVVWGGSGGLGSQAIQLAKAHGAIPVAVVSDQERGEYCMKLGAAGFINRKDFSHWGIPPHWTDADGQKRWTAAVREFRDAIWNVVGEKRNPAIVFEHPGEATIPTSLYVCAIGGMTVICAGTTGYSAMVDLRYHWVQQKRLQGSHGTNDEQARAYNDLLHRKLIDPALGALGTFEEIPEMHYQMGEGLEVFGNRACLVGASRPGLGVKDSGG
ncbi:MAG TPA: crotonyl-CoA carboxylase/reductase [Candidatus Dormibacteraeota bacterium]